MPCQVPRACGDVEKLGSLLLGGPHNAGSYQKKAEEKQKKTKNISNPTHPHQHAPVRTPDRSSKGQSATTNQGKAVSMCATPKKKEGQQNKWARGGDNRFLPTRPSRCPISREYSASPSPIFAASS